MENKIIFHAVLDEEECNRIHADIMELRPHWIQRDESGNFFTLDIAAYLDAIEAPNPQQSYYGRLNTYNSLLLNRFGILLNRVREIFQHVLDEPVAFANHLAVPGFHIFLEGAISGLGSATPHFDLQYTGLRWEQIPDEASPFSFTLPLALPAAGGGLTTWAISPSEYATVRGSVSEQPDQLMRRIDDFVDRHALTCYRYTPGVMLTQLGCTLHRIAPVPWVSPGDKRITLQGHGVRCQGRYLLYW